MSINTSSFGSSHGSLFQFLPNISSLNLRQPSCHYHVTWFGFSAQSFLSLDNFLIIYLALYCLFPLYPNQNGISSDFFTHCIPVTCPVPDPRYSVKYLLKSRVNSTTLRRAYSVPSVLLKAGNQQSTITSSCSLKKVRASEERDKRTCNEATGCLGKHTGGQLNPATDREWSRMPEEMRQ